ncbi:hypothetical protein CLOM_g6029, partial [Closterium sp. NIES-68]
MIATPATSCRFPTPSTMKLNSSRPCRHLLISSSTAAGSPPVAAVARTTPCNVGSSRSTFVTSTPRSVTRQRQFTLPALHKRQSQKLPRFRLAARADAGSGSGSADSSSAAGAEPVLGSGAAEAKGKAGVEDDKQMAFFEAIRKRQTEIFNQDEEVVRQLRIQAERDEVARIGWKRTAKKLLGRLRGSQWDPLPGADVDFADFWALLQMGRVKFVNYGDNGRLIEVILPHPAKDLGLEVKRGDGGRMKGKQAGQQAALEGAEEAAGEAATEAEAVGLMGLPEQVVWLKHKVRHMPADVHSEVWSLLRQQLAHITLINRPSAFPPAPFTTLTTSTAPATTALPSPPASLLPSLLPASSSGLLGSTLGTVQLAATWGLRLALACGLYVWVDRVLFPLYQPTKLEDRPRSSHRKLTAVLNPDLGTMGQSRARYISAEERTGITFDDFAGQDYVKRELQEVVRILRAAKEFEDLGVYCPKGVLLFGPPGTGKTLLAKAIAGEAGVPFFSVSGAEFVEMFAGVAASRVKDLFFRARQFAPAIIFIDEIDAIGSKRGTASDQGGGNIEREQGLIQILTELDGFQENQAKVLVIGATNRLDMLDPALLRKGRFDKVVRVGLPTEEGRFSVLKVHARNKAFKSEEEKLKLLREIAAATPDYSGAELMNILNEAAILAIRKDKDDIEREELLQAIDRQAGEFKTGEEDVLDSREVRMRAAYREAAIAVLECALPDSSGPILRTSLDNVDPLPNMEHERVRHRCFAVKQDMLDAIVRAFAPAIMERMVFGAANASWQAGVAYREAVQLADYVILRSGMSALGKVVYETQKDLMPH